MRLLFHQFRTEQLVFWRSREAAFFIFIFLIIIFLFIIIPATPPRNTFSAAPQESLRTQRIT